MPAAIQTQHSIMIKCEHFALAARAEKLITTGTERSQQTGFIGMITVGYRRDRATFTFRGSSDPGPVQLSQRKLPGSVFVQLVGDRVHRPSRGMHMDVGEPQQPLQRPLLNVDRLSFGVRHDVALMVEPALLGDQGSVVPAVAECPEVKPSKPPRAIGYGMQLDAVETEARHYPAQREVDLLTACHREQHARGVDSLFSLSPWAYPTMSMSTRYQPSSRQSSGWLILTPWTRLIGTDWLVRLVRPRVIRSPRGDSARVKLNMAITRRLIIDNVPMSQRDQAAQGEGGHAEASGDDQR